MRAWYLILGTWVALSFRARGHTALIRNLNLVYVHSIFDYYSSHVGGVSSIKFSKSPPNATPVEDITKAAVASTSLGLPFLS